MQIFSLDTKKCMNALLLQHVFDSFMLVEGEITTFNTYHIEGKRNFIISSLQGKL